MSTSDPVVSQQLRAQLDTNGSEVDSWDDVVGAGNLLLDPDDLATHQWQCDAGSNNSECNGAATTTATAHATVVSSW